MEIRMHGSHARRGPEARRVGEISSSPAVARAVSPCVAGSPLAVAGVQASWALARETYMRGDTRGVAGSMRRSERSRSPVGRTVDNRVNSLRIMDSGGGRHPSRSTAAEAAASVYSSRLMSKRGSPYVDCHGLVHRCFSCGAFRNYDAPARWDVLASLPLDLQGSVSHGLCEACFVREHGEPTAGWELSTPTE